jgi:enoyl-CoA hydratase
MFKSSNAKPIIAAVHGHVLGLALKLALFCDMIVASKHAKFQVTEVPRGIDGVPFWLMMANQGAGMFATDVCLTGRTWLAEEGAANGLINRLCEPGEHIQTAEALAREIMKNPPLAVRAIVEARRSALHELDVKSYAIRPRGLHTSEDFRESAQAFLEKRPPVFRGR